MRIPLVILVAASLAACTTGSSSTAASPSPSATPRPAPTPNRSHPIKAELNDLLDKAPTVYHTGCRDEEKASCKDSTRTCGGNVEAQMKAALGKKKTIAVEWEAPRETWAKNEGVLDHYWFVKPDGSGSYYYLLPSPDDVQTDCGGEYCGWHKEDFAAGALFAKGKFHFTPHKGKEIADLKFCPPAPPQPE